MRLCSKCREHKPPESFRPVKPGKGRKDGLHSWCRDCEKAGQLARWHANHEESKARQRAQYHKHREKRVVEMREYHERNRDKRIVQMAEWRTAYPDRHARAKRNWNEAHPEKSAEYSARRHARKMGAPELEVIDRAYVYERDSGVCHICGKSVPSDAYELDHLIPLSKGGPHTHANLRVAHKVCNCRRHAGRIPAQLLLVG